MIKKIGFVLNLLALVIPVISLGQSADLAKSFKQPPSEYSMIPFWSWNGTLKPEKLTWQIDQMQEKGISGAFLHARAGLDESKTPYFSDGFWKAVDTTIRYSAYKGFHTYLYDEDKWPSGSAGGRTIAANPDEFVKKILNYQKMEVVGPQLITLNLQKHPMAIFAGRIAENGNYSSDKQVNLTNLAGKQWNVPVGRWAIISFEMVKDPGAQIDYLDSAAVAKFIEVTHEEYYKRFKSYFGNTIPGIFFDEIFANGAKLADNIFWTDDFLQKFRKMKGYDLADQLPLIIFNDPGKSEKLRYDYFEVVKQLYVKAWFKQYADWCAAHQIFATGHTAEKLLHYKREADYFSTLGQLQVPGTDNEEYRYGYPRMIDYYNPKQISSIAHLYNRKRVMAESMGGGGYTIPLEEYRYGFSMLAVYGINMFIPHLFHYTMDTPETQSDWPPSWFYTNPYWKYFKPLADFASRISFMNSQGRAICDVAVLFPLTDLWENGYPDKIDDSFYKSVQQELLDNHIDYDVIDPASLADSKIEGNKIVAGNGNYRVLVLPAIHAIRSDVIKQIESFIEKGGIVIGLKDLPVLSENGPSNDAIVASKVKELFGFDPAALKPEEYFQWNKEQSEHFTAKENKIGGGAFFTRFVSQLPGIIHSRITPDFKVESNNGQYLRFNHRQTDSTNVFLLVNDTNSPEKYKISLKSLGVPSLWNPETGDIHSFENYQVKDGRLELILDFKPRESYFLAIEPAKTDVPKGLIENTDLADFRITKVDYSVKVEGWGKSDQSHYINLKIDDQVIEKKWKSNPVIPDIKMDGDWQFQLAPNTLDYKWSSKLVNDTLSIPVMKFQSERFPNEGIKNHWSTDSFDDSGWKTVKLIDEFNKKPGIQRYLSGWDASWINYYDNSMHIPEISGGERNFKKEINLDAFVKEAKVAVTADQHYELFVNEKLIGADSDWKTVEIYDLTAVLKPGKNLIEVRTANTKGLLLQGSIRLKNGKNKTLKTDESWMVSAGLEEWRPAFRLADPPMGSWGEISNPLQKTVLPVTVWYRQQLPPGAVALKMPSIKGRYSLFINGTLINIEKQKELIEISTLLKKSPNILTISVAASDKTCGLIQPVVVVCDKTFQPLISWKEMGLGWYSGRAIYTKKVEIPSVYLQKGIRLILDPGQINYFAEIWINDKLVTFCPWAPFQTDITTFVKEGENQIAIVVANLSANRATWNILDANISDKTSRWWHNGTIEREKERLVSGLLGPVRIISLSKESVNFKIK